jgi:hypothetical protein
MQDSEDEKEDEDAEDKDAEENVDFPESVLRRLEGKKETRLY